jgi:hypothetical protein
MTNIEVFKIWAQDGVLWTEWAKPVLFAGMVHPGSYPLKIPDINWADMSVSTAGKDTALIVDLPDEKGVEESLALAQFGYRPVPLYNGVAGTYGTGIAVSVRDLVRALYTGAGILQTILIKKDAPPVFMLDSRRMSGVSKYPGKYDNRWCIFPQDMPSATFLIKQGIRRVIIRTAREQDNPLGNIKDDLTHVLRRYQEAGIKMQHTVGDGEIKDITVTTPPRFKSLFYRFQVMTGLTRNAAGGFGGSIPDPQMSDSGGRYYGIG